MNLRRVILFIVLNLAVLVILDVAFCNMIPKKTALKNYWLLNKTNVNYDLAFIGPSRVLNSMDCPVFESKLNCSVINLGLSGVGYAEQYLLLKLMMEKNNVRFRKLCIEVSYYNLIDPDSSFSYPFHEYIYLPYIKREEVFDVVKENSKSKLKAYVWRYVPSARFVEFNSTYADILLFDKNMPAGVGDIDYDEKGSILLSSNEDVQQKEVHHYSNAHMDLKTRSYLEKMIELAQKNNTEVVLYTSPVFSSKVNYTQHALENYRNTVSEIVRKYHLKYYDMENSSLSNNAGNFYDITHLNKNGASLFSSQLSDSLATTL